MKTLLQIFSFLFFVSLMFAQEENYDQFRRDRHNQYRSQIDRRKALNQKETNRSSNNMPQQLEQNSKPTHKISGSGVDTAWVRHYGWNDFSLVDVPEAVAVDGSGNVIVAGNNGSGGTGPGGPPLDFMIVKYNPNGDLLWVRDRLGSNINRKDAIAIDAMGNVYVALGSEGIESGVGRSVSKYITVIKYAANGDTVWVRQFHEPTDVYFFPLSIAVDEYGNVYVLGTQTVNFSYNGDFITIKYSSKGEIIWVRKNNGSDTTSNRSSSLAVDKTGNVCVTGRSWDGISYDYKTIKYNANGDTLWVTRYNGQGNNDDRPTSIAADEIGNVYVTGRSAGNGTSYDYATIKYNANGDEQWVRRYNGPGNSDDSPISIALDINGNVIVTGYSGLDEFGDYVTIKYNANGDTVWVRRYNDIANQNDSPSSLVIDGNGNILVTGTSRGINNLYSYATVKYKANGDEEWVRRYNGANGNYVHAVSLTSDVNENVFVTGISGGDIQTIKYTANGDSVWGKLYDSKTSTDVARSIALDGGGNVYISGHNEGGPSSRATIKYNSSGDMLWQKQYGPPDHYWESVRTVDKNGNAYCIGHIDDTSSTYAVVKYNSFGDTMWVKRYSECDPTSIAVDGNQDVYVAGNIIGSVGYSTAKLDPQGDTLWVKRYCGQTDIDGRVSALTVDVAGNVYVTGWCATPSTNSDFVTIKYNPQGDILWVRRYHSPGESVDRAYAYALAVDAGGNVYVTGNSTGLAYTISRLVTIKYDQNGETIWAKRFNGIGNSYDYPQALAVDGIGNVYATGTSYSNDPFQAPSTYLVIKYNSLGDTLWVRRYSSPETNNNVLYSLCLDAVGNVYVTGSSGNEIATVKYSASGMEEWVARFSDGEGSYDTPCGVKVDGAGNVFVGGTSSSGDFRSMYTIIKYRQTPNAIGKDNTILPMRFALEQNFPNPFNPTTTIRYSLPSSAHVRLTVYDMLGREITTLVNEEQSAGWKRVQWNAKDMSTGIYFYKLTAGNFVETKKMIVVK